MAVNPYYCSTITELLISDLVWCKFKGMHMGCAHSDVSKYDSVCLISLVWTV